MTNNQQLMNNNHPLAIEYRDEFESSSHLATQRLMLTAAVRDCLQQVQTGEYRPGVTPELIDRACAALLEIASVYKRFGHDEQVVSVSQYLIPEVDFKALNEQGYVNLDWGIPALVTNSRDDRIELIKPTQPIQIAIHGSRSYLKFGDGGPWLVSANGPKGFKYEFLSVVKRGLTKDEQDLVDLARKQVIRAEAMELIISSQDTTLQALIWNSGSRRFLRRNLPAMTKSTPKDGVAVYKFNDLPHSTFIFLNEALSSSDETSRLMRQMDVLFNGIDDPFNEMRVTASTIRQILHARAHGLD